MGWGPIKHAIRNTAARENNIRHVVNTPVDGIPAARRALSAMQQGHESHVISMHKLAALLGDRYQLVGATADFEEARQIAGEVIQLTAQGHSRRADFLQNLGCLLQHRYNRTRQPADLEEAIHYTRESLDVPARSPTQLATSLSHLALCLKHRFKQDGTVVDIEDAVKAAQEALLQTPLDDELRKQYLDNLALLLFDQYAATPETSILEAAMSVGHEAILKTPPSKPDRITLLTHLAKAYHVQYQTRENMSDLEMAIKLHNDSKELADPNSPEWTARSYFLGAVYLDRYRRTQSEADLKAAMSAASSAVYAQATSEFSPGKSERIAGLACVYHERYLRTGSLDDLETATKLYQTAVDSTHPGDPGWAGHVHLLGRAHMDRHRVRVPGSSLELADRLIREAVDVTPPGHVERALRIETLGHVYKMKSEDGTGGSSDLEAAVRLFQEAADTTPQGHPSRASRLRLLAQEYESRYIKSGSKTNLETTIGLLQDALADTWSSVHARLTAGKDLVSLVCRTKDWHRAYQTAETVITLIPSLAPLSLGHTDKKFLLSQFGSFASDAAAIALNAEKSPFDALQLLELGSGVLAGSLSALYVDISVLLQRHPEIAARYTKLRDEVDMRAKADGFPRPDDRYFERLRKGHWFSTSEIKANESYNAGKAFEDLLGEIRNLPGFENFLLAPSQETVKAAADRGPLIVINVSEHRCDAILVTTDGIREIPLPLLLKSEVENKIRSDELGTLSTLFWLWNTVANPVLNALGYIHQPLADGNNWPHVWWIPTGPLAKFPLHAAGAYHNSQAKLANEDTVLDRVMSSYSTSIKTIIHARSSSSSTTHNLQAPGRAVLLDMDNTPNLPGLPHAALEISQLRALFLKATTGLLDPVTPLPLKEAVMSEVAKPCAICHFAGHGCVDAIDALESYLCLGDESTVRYGEERLKVLDLWKLNLRGDHNDQAQGPFLAYLSACSTGRIRDERSVQESIHLIGAFQGAGFRHVIGTLWEVNDALCVDMARITYEKGVLKGTSGGGGGGGGGLFDDEAVCKGLHDAMRELRGRWVERGIMRERNREMRRRMGRRGLVVGHEVGDGRVGESRGEVHPRKVVLCDSSDDDKEETIDVPYWIPYVHFGV